MGFGISDLGIFADVLSDGQCEWVRTYDTLNYEEGTVDLAIDSSGNAMVLGNMSISPSNKNVRILKYNTTGDLQWSRKIGYLGEDVTACRIVCNNSKNIYIALNYVDVFNDQNGLVFKFNSSGTELWSEVENDIYFSRLVIGNNGNIYVS